MSSQMDTTSFVPVERSAESRTRDSQSESDDTSESFGTAPETLRDETDSIIASERHVYSEEDDENSEVYILRKRCSQ